ncbi:hypothetical protein QQZ08_003614 [Neonectria magnoliae]|uniref:FAD-binding PCMH-type domain-containing protein n=1 Tax=Neonectria magnoliae TaxID=2732573 RepID=A0ABR1I9R8_9HYPO
MPRARLHTGPTAQKISPAYIVRPRSAEEVATAVKALNTAGERFAVRSGGHTNWAGSNNIEAGVTIDLNLLDQTKFDEASEIANIGPGVRWRQVYAELHKYGRVVAGGREGNVCVAGLLLDGGNTFFTARKGFACDNVVSYEVVLADGSIVTAEAENNTDLFRVLKGGSNNFGIVTNFKMSSIPCGNVWGGMTFFLKQVVTATSCALSHTCLTSKTSSSLPLELPEMMSTVKMTSASEMAFEYNIPAQYQYNDIQIITKASRLHEQLVEELKALITDGDFITKCLFQLLPKIFAQNSVAAGGNIMGVEQLQQNGILFLVGAMVRSSEQARFAQPKVKAWIEAVQEFAKTLVEDLQWAYLNYGVENVRKMKEAAAKYDPRAVFQTLCPSGFKISDVK